jgi:hypothetical protein
MNSATANSSTAEKREWWRREAARRGSDWNGIMELRASVGSLACSVCGAVPWNPSFCATCRLGEMVASGLLDAHAAATVIAEAATRAGLFHSEAERTAWGDIRRTGGVHA